MRLRTIGRLCLHDTSASAQNGLRPAIDIRLMNLLQ
jgi:hypothetical protein